MTPSSGDWSTRRALIFSALCVVLLGSFVAYYELTSPSVVLSQPLAAGASVVFWIALTVLVLGYPFRKSLAAAYSGLQRSVLLRVLAPTYLLVHLLIYGILLEWILIGTLGGPVAYETSGIFLSGSFSFYPHSLSNTVLSLALSPSATVLIPPYFGATISVFAGFTAVTIDILVVANVALFLRVKSRLKKVTGSVVVPLAGIVLGSVCCLSIPELLAIAAPVLAVTLATPLGLAAQDALYYLLPISVVVALALNFNSLAKIDYAKSVSLSR
jgi:hypothetical protein